MPPKRKKILFVITKSNWGGAQRYVFDLATHLSREEFDVAVVFGAAEPRGTDAGALAHALQEHNIRTLFLPQMKRDIGVQNDWQTFRALTALFKEERPDVVHLNSSKAGGLGALAGRVAGVQRILFTAHGWPFWEKRNPLIRALIFLLSYATVLLSHTTICISNFDKRYTRFMPFTRKKVTVIYNGIAPIHFLSKKEARDALIPEAMQEAHKDDLWVVYMGELHPNKNLFASIDAVAHHNERRAQKCFYTIVGDGQERTALEKYIREKKLENQIFLAGFVRESSRYLHGFDTFLLPSKKEGVPYVLLEAGLSELPAVASNVGGIPEVLEHNKSGILIDPREPASITRALDTLSSQKKLRITLGAALYREVQKKFTLDRMLVETTLLYRPQREE